MAARAHVIRDYSFAGPASRPRRQVWINDDDDEVVLPRRRSNVSGALVFSAILASALVGGLAYAVYWAAPPKMAETPALPLEKSYSEDPLWGRANMVRALTGPAQATPPAPEQAVDATTPESAAAVSGTEPGRDEVILNDAAPGFQQSLPQPSADEPSRTQPALTQPRLPDPVLPRKEAPAGGDAQPVYPPPTTPPEMIESPSLPEPVAPRLDADNPY